MNNFSQIYPHQRVNVIPGMDVLCYKNAFFQALSRMHHHFPSLSSFFPITFQLPFQFAGFQREHLRLCAELSQRPPASVSQQFWRTLCGRAGESPMLIYPVNSHWIRLRTDLDCP
jgi:hypothetical protein